MEDKIVDIKPLDCIFFHGTEFISRMIIKMEEMTLGAGEWSHVGIVINKEMMPSLNVKDNDLYLWESTISSKNKLITECPTLDAESGKPVFGVQIRKLKDVIDNNIRLGVKVGWGRLRDNPVERKYDETNFDARICALKNILDRIHKENYHRPYAKNICRLFSAMFTCSSCCRKDWCLGENWRFCSQFIVIIYKSIGVLSDEFDPEIVVPQDIATPEMSDEHIPKILDDVVILTSDNYLN